MVAGRSVHHLWGLGVSSSLSLVLLLILLWSLYFIFLHYYLFQLLNYSYLNSSVLSFSCSPPHLTADKAKQG